MTLEMKPGDEKSPSRQQARGGGLLQLIRDLGIYKCRAKTCQCAGRYHIHNTDPLKTILELTKEEPHV